MVFRRRTSMALRPINRIKHVFDSSATVAANTVIIFDVAVATDTPTLAVTNAVETGSKINGIYCRIEIASDEAIDLGAVPRCYMYLAKNPGNNVTLPFPATVGSDDNKRFVIHQEMSMIENKGRGSNARTLFNGVVVIPKGMRRMAPNDKIVAHVVCPQLNTAICVQFHYKEFR